MNAAMRRGLVMNGLPDVCFKLKFSAMRVSNEH
jgi:hypothetical protein